MPDGVKIMNANYRGYVIRWSPNGSLPPMEYIHDDYDGPGDPRAGRQHTLADCLADIDQLEGDE
jgi:hypothetical protein